MSLARHRRDTTSAKNLGFPDFANHQRTQEGLKHVPQPHHDINTRASGYVRSAANHCRIFRE